MQLEQQRKVTLKKILNNRLKSRDLCYCLSFRSFSLHSLGEFRSLCVNSHTCPSVLIAAKRVTIGQCINIVHMNTFVL